MHQQTPPPPFTTPKPPKKLSLLIPTKRPLLPPYHSTKSSSATTNQTPTPKPKPKSINPSSVPAGIQFRRPAFSSIHNLDEQDREEREGQEQRQWNNDTITAAAAAAAAAINENQKTDTDTEPVLIEVEIDFSCPPQPFLDVDVWGRWEGRRKDIVTSKGKGVKGRDGVGVERGGRDVSASTSASASASHGGVTDIDEPSGMEYGSMAVQTRKKAGGGRHRSRRGRGE